MKTGVIVLSRHNSNRLPGKALMEIESKKVLDYIIERLQQVVDRSQIIIATSDSPSDNPIKQFANSRNISCFRGSSENVAERFYNAACSQNWDYAVRINGDNIFVDTRLLKEMLRLTESGRYDFISNVKGRTFPKGMSIEIVKLNYFATLLPVINAHNEYKEHVTLCLYQQHEQSSFQYVYNTNCSEAAGIQMALDTPGDFERTQKIIAQFSAPHWEYNLEEIFAIWKRIYNEQSI